LKFQGADNVSSLFYAKKIRTSDLMPAIQYFAISATENKGRILQIL